MTTSSLLSKLVSIATESTVMSETSYCVTLGCNSCCKQVKIKIKTTSNLRTQTNIILNSLTVSLAYSDINLNLNQHIIHTKITC